MTTTDADDTAISRRSERMLSAGRVLNPAPGSGAGGEGGRILLVSYHFPPSQATGSVRWEYLAKHAVEQGWGVDVVTLDPDDLDSLSWRRVDALPERVRVIGVRERRLLAERMERGVWFVWKTLRGLVPSRGGDVGSERGKDRSTSTDPLTYPRDQLPGLFSSPRAILRAFWAWRKHAVAKAWARRAERAAREILDPDVHRVVVTCGPPHQVHWAGRKLSRRSDLPLVLDFRDAWYVTEVVAEEFASPVWDLLTSSCERRCIQQASLVVANTEPLRDQMRREYPDADCRMIAVHNGFDESDIRPPAGQERFVIAYAGAIYLNRDPRPLMRAVASLAEGLDLGPDDLTVEFMGQVGSFGGVPLPTLAREAGMEDHLRLHPPSSREDAMDFLARAAVLVSLPQELEMAIPSKIFDYMQYHAWIVAQAREGSASEQLLRDTRAAVVDPDDEQGLAGLLDDLYRRFEAGERPRPLAEEHPELSRRAQADQFLRELERWR